ncbi:hypothetical protein DI09_129p60 [Mitosporidium daphniae]|uniref:GYF domain-containing protein n=1 Tax=Mitosporidium daphniae TaxID=1485682 RepID=A0A098VUY2_9MICR|nr:uncharacterized protein DI09_129p60 [Mitosporidium daphniae]KGG52883.1 hypothetical protein DI09_129p60 [Mitosporidium daphniae]|eukprot:XP_013239319.1 uncharacterized protein DI09_129p60 [Mitosporidium daphniae]
MTSCIADTQAFAQNAAHVDAPRLCIKNILSSCPIHPKRSELPLPASVTCIHQDVFITASVDGEEFSEAGVYSQKADDFSLLSPILYSVFSFEDLTVMDSPIAIPQPRKPMNANGNIGDKQNNSTQHHGYSRNNRAATYGDSSEFITQRGGGRRFQGQHRSAYGNQHHGNRANSDGSGDSQQNYGHHNRHHYQQHADEKNQQPKKSIDSFVSQFESMAPYKSRELDSSSMEDPWADPSASVGSFDSSGNFITSEFPKKDAATARSSRIPIQQSRLSSIISSKIITAESLEATLFQNSISSEGELNVAIPFFNLWYYKDPYGNIQGPFPSEQMTHWSEAGYFDLKMLVRPDVDSASTFNNLSNLSIVSDFVPLSEWINLYNHNWPWSNQAKNIVYSVKQPQSSKPEPMAAVEIIVTQEKESHSSIQKSNPITQNSETEYLKPSITEPINSGKTPEHVPLPSEEIKDDAQKKTEQATPIEDPEKKSISATKFKGWATSTNMADPAANIRTSIQENSRSKRIPEPQSAQPLEHAVANVRSKPTSWSSIASSGFGSHAEPVEGKPTPSKASNATNSANVTSKSQPQPQEAFQSQGKPSQSSKSDVKNEKSDSAAALGKWVSKELSRMNIKNIDSTTLTTLLFPLSVDQMKDILTEFLPTASEISEFIAGFTEARASTPSLNGLLPPTLVSAKKKTATPLASDSKEADGFSVVVRKTKKSAPAAKTHSTHEAPGKRIVGL